MKKWIFISLFLLVLAAAFFTLKLRMHPEASVRTEPEIIYEMVKAYKIDSDSSGKKIQSLLAELERISPDSATHWHEIMKCWAEDGSDMTIYPGVLPDGLDNSAALCIIVLGYQLNPDGSIKDELLGRLQAARSSAQKYPNAYILCSGGGTATASTTTEAEAMANWLIQNGIEESRVLTESRSLTTTENAIYCGRLLKEQYPDVAQAALISSDYHLPWATVLFQAEFILDNASITLAANAAYPTATKLYGTSLLRYQANGILEIASYH